MARIPQKWIVNVTLLLAVISIALHLLAIISWRALEYHVLGRVLFITAVVAAGLGVITFFFSAGTMPSRVAFAVCTLTLVYALLIV